LVFFNPLDDIQGVSLSGLRNNNIFMKLIVLIIFAIVTSISLPAQRKKNVVVGDRATISFDQGKTLYDKDNYTEAIPFFLEAINAEPGHQDATYYLALSYRYTEQDEKAIPLFKHLERINSNYWGWFYYEWGLANIDLKKFDDAIPLFEKFDSKFSNEADNTIYHHKAKYKIRYAKGQATLQNTKTGMKAPVKLSDKINSPYNDYAPVADPTGTKLYFTSRRKGGISKDDSEAEQGDEDIYVIEKTGDVWGEPTLMPEPINTDKMEGIDFISADGQLIGFTSSRDGGVGSSDIYLSTLEGNRWTPQVNMGNVVNGEDWDSNSTISSDGHRIIFASSRKGGYGQVDLYMTEKNIFGDWGPAMNLGGMVNTPSNDTNPFLSQDGKTLYFASDGHPGFGSYDIFKTVLEDGRWTVPINLGRPLNTPGRDDYFTIGGSGEKGYFSSYESDGKNSDIYEIEMPEEMRPQPTVIVEGVVTNAKTQAVVGGYVMVEDLNTAELIAVSKSNSATGKYLVVLPAGKTYSVSANKEGFFFHSELFDIPSTSKFKTIKKDIELKPIEKGAKIVLNNIFFETGKATLTSQSRVELEKAINLMKTNVSMIIEVGGHTDNVGDDAFNMKLSHERAKSVREYLVNGGIESNRVQAKGYGESNPVATNDTDDGRKSNRRTEFIILEF
jgi:outer membrane protein OmpA-like peptidoglycan-associated protein